MRIGDLPADTGTVVVHRVSALSSGAIDSVPIGPAGGFSFTIPSGATEDVFFASVRVQGILYLGGPVTDAADTVGSYIIQSWPAEGVRADTRPTIRVRNTFLERTEELPGWSVTDYFEITNPTRTTLIASEEGETWSHELPPGATDFRVGESDLSPDGASFSGGRVYVSTPVQPGETLYQLRYRLPTDDFTLPISGGTASMELLVRDPRGPLEVEGLAAVGQVEMESGAWQRFAGRELAASAVTIGPAGNPARLIPLVASVLLLVFAAIGALLLLRSDRARSVKMQDRQALLLEIARIDERRKRNGIGKAEYERRRRRLLAALADLPGSGPGPSPP